jgi:hypothetical protein
MFVCWVDASHAGEWKKETAADDIDTAKSRTGCIIMFAGCPLIWSSKLQTEIALSSTKVEYIALSTTMREVIHLIDFLQEAKMKGIPINIDKAAIHCRTFEDNSGAIEMAKVLKMRPRTKQLNIKYNHFHQHEQSGLLLIHVVSTNDQIADIFTKHLIETTFKIHRQQTNGW